MSSAVRMWIYLLLSTALLLLVLGLPLVLVESKDTRGIVFVVLLIPLACIYALALRHFFGRNALSSVGDSLNQGGMKMKASGITQNRVPSGNTFQKTAATGVAQETAVVVRAESEKTLKSSRDKYHHHHHDITAHHHSTHTCRSLADDPEYRSRTPLQLSDQLVSHALAQEDDLASCLSVEEHWAKEGQEEEDGELNASKYDDWSSDDGASLEENNDGFRQQQQRHLDIANAESKRERSGRASNKDATHLPFITVSAPTEPSEGSVSGSRQISSDSIGSNEPTRRRSTLVPGSNNSVAVKFPLPVHDGTNLPQRYFVRNPINPGFIPPDYLVDQERAHSIEPPRRVKTIIERIAELTSKQQAAFYQMKTLVELEGWGAQEAVDDWRIIRYLFARSFTVKKSMAMLKASIEWEQKMKPATVRCSACDENPSCHMNDFVGWDKQHRPVIYTSYLWATERQNPTTALEHNIQTFAQVVGLMPAGVEQWVVVTDFVSYSHWRDGSSKVGKAVVDVLQAHYPERLGVQVLVDPPTTFWLLFKMLSPFIDKRTLAKAKIVYADQNPNIDDVFPEMFPPHVSEYMLKAYRNNKEVFANRKKAKSS